MGNKSVKKEIRMRVLDSTFLIDLLRGKSNAVNLLDSNISFFTTQINMFEVLQGFFYDDTPAQKILESLQIFESVHLLHLNDNSTIRAAEISAQLIKEGKHVPDSDCLVAGISLAHNVPFIITRNKKHFRIIPGLKVETY